MPALASGRRCQLRRFVNRQHNCALTYREALSFRTALLLERAAVLPGGRLILQSLFSFERFCDVDLRGGIFSSWNGFLAHCRPLVEIAGSYCNRRFCVGVRVELSFRARDARRLAVGPNRKQAV